MADGCVTERQVIVVLQEQDADHLREFAAALGCGDRPLAPANNGHGRRLVIGSAELARTIASHGVVPRRTAPVTPRLLTSRDFWRGVVDGDGTLRAEAIPSLEVVGRPALMHSFSQYLERMFDDGRPVQPYRHSQSTAVVMVGCGGRRAKIAADHLYRHASPALARKAARAARIMAWEPKVRSRYPWEIWGDGAKRRLSRGVDYDEPRRLWEAGRRAAREANRRLAFVDEGDHVLLQFVPRSPR